MADLTSPIDIYIEAGKKKTFACAVDWPGWCRSGRDEQAALQALADYAPRYAAVLSGLRLGFQAPAGGPFFNVIERLDGNTTTEFGAPGVIPAVDEAPMSDGDLQRSEHVLKACWSAFDAAVLAAAGKELRKGPRGGGRDLDEMVRHVLGAELGYLNAVGWKLETGSKESPADELKRIRQAVLDATRLSASGKLPKQGPRGGLRWPARYFVRRLAWHVLDHTWEIEDRA